MNRIRTISRRREDYVGQWLPEPVRTVPDVADDVELADNVSIAMLAVLESLAPVERAVFVLREVFDVLYDDIAESVGKSAVAVRQILSRARSHVAARRPRMSVDRSEQREIIERFITAVNTGDMQGLMDVLAPDVVLIADGGGIAQAVLAPVYGAKKVANLLRPYQQNAVNPESEVVWLNGDLGIQIDDEVAGRSLVSLVMNDGTISRIFVMRNPEKLSQLSKEIRLVR